MAFAKAGLLVLVLVVWQLAPLPDYILSPLEIARHFVQALGEAELYENIRASLARSLPGFALGSALGALLGLAAGTARWFDRMLSPAVFLTYPVPKIVMLPIFMIWFGIGDLSRASSTPPPASSPGSSTATSACARPPPFPACPPSTLVRSRA